MKTAALDLAPAGIRVDAVSPGVVNSQPGRLSVIRKVLEHALGFGDVWITTGREIAEWWHAHREELER